MSEGNSAFAKVIADVAQQCNCETRWIEDLYPCTPLQHGLFVLSSTSDGAYITQHVFRLQQNVDSDRLRKAWETVITRNAILRTRIVDLESRVLQVVIKNWLPEWKDFSVLSNYLAIDKQQSMEYGQPLLRLGMSETHLVWTAHHSIYDGFSEELMLEDISKVYAGDLPPIRQPFRSFVKYVQKASDNAESKSFWASSLKVTNAPSFPVLPPNYRPRPTDMIEHDAFSVFHNFSEITPATVAQSAWALVLSSQLGSTSVAYGSTLSGRNVNMAGIDKVMGPTLSTIPISFAINYEQSVAQYLHNVQQHFVQMIPHVHVGLQTIKEISPEAARATEFQSLFAVHSVGQEDSVKSYEHLLVSEHMADSTDYLSYALTLQCFITNSGKMKVVASFDSTVIDRSLVQRLIQQLEHVIRQLGSAESQKPLRGIQLVSPEDLKQIELWNQKPEVPPGFALDEIRKKILVRPNSTAICAWDGEISYAELDNLTSILAQYMITEHGVGPEVIVPVCFEKSKWMTVAVVAIMKTGAAFCLLDPLYPLKRLETIVALTGAKVILASPAYRTMFNQSSIKSIVLDDASFEPRGTIASVVTLPAQSQSPCSEWLSLENAMYVVFTSGSTGEPKGVVITFGSYYAGAMAHIPIYELGPQSRNLTFVSPAFDLCIQEMVSTLMAGGCLCVPSESDRLGGITNVIQSMRANIASITPSFARQINPDDVPSLKRLAFVGEAVPKDCRDIWADKIWLHNSYGPAECSVISTINKKLTKASNPANIGSIIIGSGFIVDPENCDRLMPIGAVGELLIEGPLLGRGYLNNPEKTAAVFVEKALRTIDSGALSRRFYKTGDLVRYDTDGTLIFVGRKDTQVKIRGQRVEISEIETHLRGIFSNSSGVGVELSKHDDISELIAFVFCGELWDDVVQPQELAFLLSNGEVHNMSDTRSRLRQVLPHHMIPTRCYLARELPVMPSGKLDRKHLQKEIANPSGSYIQMQESEAVESLIDPGDKLALQLSEKIISMLESRGLKGAKDLQKKDCSLTDLGVDSVQFIAILAFIRKEYGVKLSVAVLYDENLTISSLARIVADHQAGSATPGEEHELDLRGQIKSLYDDLVKRIDTHNQPTRTFFLTGATGYLGSQILRQLLNTPSVKRVYVHVRAQNETEALKRIVNVASIGKWWSTSYLPRIVCWVGDLAVPQLGLSSEKWSMITGDCHASEQIDCIIHNGATVQWQAPYSALKSANVGSTLELLHAISQCPAPRNFTYVSGGADRTKDVEDFVKYLQRNSSGYSQTKYVAEQITERFADNLPPNFPSKISILRPGFIIGTEREGVPNTDDFLWRLVQACVSISSYPADDQDFWLTVADVQEVAAAVVSSNLALDENREKISRVQTGLFVVDFWEIVNEELNHCLRPVTGEEWVHSMKSFLAKTEDNNAFQPFMAMLKDSSFSLGLEASGKTESNSRVFAAIRKNLRTLLDSGYLSTELYGKNSKFAQNSTLEHSTTFSRSGFKNTRLKQITSSAS